MRVLCYKHCANIRFGTQKESNAGNHWILSTIKNIQDGGNEVAVITIDRYKDEVPQNIKFFNWQQWFAASSWADAIVIFNGPFNAYGGVISDESIHSYEILSYIQQVKKPSIYAVNDLAINIGDCAGWVRNKQSKGEYVDLDPNRYEFDASRMLCVTEAYDLKCQKEIWKGSQNNFGGYVYFPFETTVLYRPNLMMKINENPTTDLIYFGNPRGGKRDKKVYKYYFNHTNFNVDVYGNGWDFNKMMQKFGQCHAPNNLGKIDTNDLIAKINSSIAHCYISDPKCEGTIWTFRFYEAVANRSVMFIDQDNDPQRKRFKDPFFYVNTGAELNQKIVKLKEDPTLRIQMLQKQFDEVIKPVVQIMPNYIKIWNYNLSKAVEVANGTRI